MTKIAYRLIAMVLGVSQVAMADTALDGYWALDARQGITCDGDRRPAPAAQSAFIAKYGQTQLHLSALQAVTYWTTASGEQVTVRDHLLETEDPGKYVIRRFPRLTVADIELSLRGENLDFASTDTEFEMCLGEKYHIKFVYLRLNP